jgi:hypothetical protein
MADPILELAVDLNGPSKALQFEHPVTGELLRGSLVSGTTNRYQVTLPGVVLPSPYPFKLRLNGKVITQLAEIIDLRPPVEPADPTEPVGTSSTFAYTVPEGSTMSSAGVYQGDTLVRELWGNKPEISGIGKTGIWDGRLNNLSVASAGTYDIRVQTHGIETAWEGVGGNTAWPATNLGTMQRGYQFMRNIVQTNSKRLHYVKHFTEGESPAGYVTPTDLQNRVELFPRFGVGTTSEFNATDGLGVWLTRLNRNKGNETVMPSWTTGYSDTTGKFLSFSSGTSYTPDPDHPEQAEPAINFLNPGDTSNIPTGLAVQRTGNLLFMPYSGNKVTVANKLTGAVLGSTTMPTPSSGTVDGDDNPWFISAGQVLKYTANPTTGALASTGAPLPNLVAPLAISAYGDLMMVCDGGTSQQRKLYRLSTRELLYTSPIAGGYANNPNVFPDRHCFSDAAGTTDAPGVHLLADGSYWIVETTLCRAQHFAADHSLLEQIAYIDHAYQLAVDQNNPKSVFVKGLEFEIDYSKPWPEGAKLVRFWRAMMPAAFFKLNNRKQSIEVSPFNQVATLSNGGRYIWIRERERDLFREFELTQTAFRPTGASETIPVSLGADGSLNYASFVNNGKDYQTRARYLTSFDANRNPQRAAAVEVHLAPNVGDQAPIDYSGYPSATAFVRTASGKRVFFQDGLMRKLGDKVFGYGYHIGIGPEKGKGYTALTAFATPGAEYRGPYPTDGSYDVGNHGDYKVGTQQGYGGGQVRAAGEIIYYNYYGEFWGPEGKQLNKRALIHSSGLPLLVAGPTYKDADNSPTGYFGGMAGGVQMGEFLLHPTNADEAFEYHSEENGFCGAHRWHYKKLSTIKTATVATVTVAADTVFPSTLPADTTDLLAAVPARSNFQAGVPGFTQTPLAEDLSAEFGGSYWGVRTSIKKYDRFDTPDVFIRFRQASKTNTFAFPSCLPTGTTSTTWQVRETLNFDEHSFNDGEITDAISGGLYHDLLDQSGKVLVRFYLKANYAASPSQASIFANDKVISTGLLSVLGDAAALNKELLHTYDNGTATVQYGAYPAVTLSGPFTAGADFTTPGRLQVTCWQKGNGANRDRCVDISRLHCYVGKPTPPTGSEYSFTPADASASRVNTGVQEVMNVSTSAQLKTLLSSNLTNRKIVIADGTYTDNFEQTGTWSNVWLTSASNNTTFTGAGYSVLLILQGSAVRTKVRISHIKFNYTGTGNSYALLYWNELGTYTGLEIDHCSFSCPNGNVNALGCSQYSVISGKGGIAKDVYIHDNDFPNVGRIAIELLNQGYDQVRLTNLLLDNNTFGNLGLKDGRHGMAISLSGLIQRIGIKGNKSTGGKYCIYELVNVLDVIAEDNDGMSQDISTIDGKPSACSGWSISKDPTNPAPKNIYIKGGMFDVSGRPIQIYDAISVTVDGANKLWKGHRSVQMNLINSTLKRLNLLIQSTVKEASLELTAGTGNAFSDSKISSAGSAAAGYLPGYEATVARAGTSGNSFTNVTTEVGLQANGQPFAPSPETGADGRIVDQGTNNTITNNTKRVVA